MVLFYMMICRVQKINLVKNLKLFNQFCSDVESFKENITSYMHEDETNAEQERLLEEARSEMEEQMRIYEENRLAFLKKIEAGGRTSTPIDAAARSLPTVNTEQPGSLPTSRAPESTPLPTPPSSHNSKPQPNQASSILQALTDSLTESFTKKLESTQVQLKPTTF